MIDIEIDNPLEADKKIGEWRIKQLTVEIIRLRLKCGEEITSAEILMGFANPKGGFNLKPSENYYLHTRPKNVVE